MLFASSGNVILANIKAVREFQTAFNSYLKQNNMQQVSAGTLNAMGLLDEIFHLACYTYRRQKNPDAFKTLLARLESRFGKRDVYEILHSFGTEFPPVEVYNGTISLEDYLNLELTERKTKRTRTNMEQTLEEMVMLRLANENPAFKPFSALFDDSVLTKNELWNDFWSEIQSYFKTLPYWGTFGHDLISFLREPVVYAPDNIQEQLNYVRIHWADLLVPGDGEGEDYWLKRLLGGMDLLSEEWKPEWHPTNGGSPDMSPPNYDYLMKEYERFSDDKEWMPRVVLMAKTVLVWLYQLSKKYNRDIHRLDQIPDEELDLLRDEGFTGLWLIGLWERSNASRTIKQVCGNPEAAASAYSLDDYEIAENLGGWGALDNLRARLWKRGIRLASDMVPNHTGLDAKWVIEKPDLFVQRKENPFPQYTYNGINLSRDNRVAIYLEDHYYSKSDCAVCFKRVDTYTGDTRYIYHGNDGTGMPWNDTAQIDFLNPQAREEVIQKILHVARNFPIIRFDAAMVLAKKHIKRLWYPEPGKGGDIATRSEFALTAEEFERAIPNEFWREVVDRVANEVPDTLLLAEAFWMMEGYFTRTLGMHRVYNSAFMNMLKKEENFKYRATVKNTIEFDPQILKRYVNFMNNPDEETAVAQFGKGDKYFGVCTLMSTMPGLPMFGHGQLEGFEEKYGMEYVRAYRDETPDEYLMERHRREIFPLLKKRYLFSGVENFLFYDVWNNGQVNENVFAYTNSFGNEFSAVFYNNVYERAAGWIKQSCAYAVKTGSGENDKKLVTRSLAEGLGLTDEPDAYMLFKEQRSGLWYIRKSQEICRKGMFISLNGFETQIFLDIHQKKDADGSLGELCAFLNGAGTPDLHIAWQELHYKELYAALKNVISPELCKMLADFTKSEKDCKAKNERTVSAAELKKQLKDGMAEFYEIANQFAEEEFKVKLNEATQTDEKSAEHSAKTKTAAAQKKITKKRPVFKPFAAPKTIPVVAEKDALTNARLILLSLLMPIAESGKAREWNLQRKMEEFTRNSPIAHSENYGWFEKAFALSEPPAPSLKISDDDAPKAKKHVLKTAAECVAIKLTDSRDAWILTGAHEFDGTKWFNKEKMESTLAQYSQILQLNADSEQKKQILSLFKTIDDAQKKAEYKCRDFTEAFANHQKAKAKKPTEKETEKAKKPKSTKK